MTQLSITICGGGNGSHACAALMAQKGHKVTLFTPVHGEAKRLRDAYTENGGFDAVIGGKTTKGLLLEKIIDDPSEALPKADLIFVIVPAFAHRDIFRHLARHMNPDALVAVLPSRGMIELDARLYLPSRNFVAFQTLPWACRIIQPGKSVDIKGTKKCIQAATLPQKLSKFHLCQLQHLLDMEIKQAEHILTLTLSNIGQLFHPGIMYGLFQSDPKRLYAKKDVPLFYQGVDDATASVLEGMAEEIQQITAVLHRHIPELEPEQVLTPQQWLMESYGECITDKSSLRRMLNTNKAYEGISVPVVEENDGYRINFNVRYVTEDVPYSLLVTRTLGGMAKVETPVIDRVIDNLGQWNGVNYLDGFIEHSRLPLYYGVNNLEDLALLA